MELSAGLGREGGGDQDLLSSFQTFKFHSHAGRYKGFLANKGVHLLTLFYNNAFEI